MKNSVKLDPSRLLGLRLQGRAIGGSKLGVKGGPKLGVKQGAKLGFKTSPVRHG